MDKRELANKILALEGLSNDEKSALLGLLHEQKKYGLVWEDKPEDVELQMARELPVLTEVKERAIISEAPEAPNHILIEGDNLHALTALTYTHAGKIDVIYIDPPYNTGNKDFVYNDRYVDKEDSYRHSKWLSFMSKRLQIAKGLLTEDGVMFISIDDHEQSNLKMLCDEVFGEDYIEQYIWCLQDSTEGSFVKTPGLTVRKEHEYLIACFKNKGTRFKKYKGVADFKEGAFCNPDNDSRGPWFSGNISRNGIKSTTGSKYYTITNPAGISFTRNWTLSKEEYETAFADNRIFFAKGGQGVPRLKIFQNADKFLVQSSLFTDVHTSITGKNELKEIFGTPPLDFPKPTTLILRLIEIAMAKKNGLILDFFAGSGTTLHATMKLNADDGGHRQCILVTNNENNICEEVTYVRNRRVIQGYTTPKGEKIEGLHSNTLRYYRTDFVPRVQTIANMRALTNAATDLLCIKNNVYQEVGAFGGRKIPAKIARYFDDGKTKMLVIYAEVYVPNFVEMLRNMAVDGKILVYVFSNSNYAYDDDFEEVLDKVELCALPDAIYKAYKKVLRPVKAVQGTDEAADVGEEDAQ